MMERLNKEQTKAERRKLLFDPVYILMSDVLKQLQKEGKTQLSHVESFLLAREFAHLLLSLGDAEEGIDDELEDLEDEGEGANDAVIIAIVAATIMQAAGKKHPEIDARPISQRIISHWVDHPLTLRILGSAAKKEKDRWQEGKFTQLLNYEIKEIERNGEGEEVVRRFFLYAIGMADSLDSGSIKGFLLVMSKYNNDHGHRFDNEVNALYEKLGIKSKTLFNFERMNDIHGNTEVNIGQ